MVEETQVSAAHVVSGSTTAVLLKEAGQGDQLAWRQLFEQYDVLIRSVAGAFRFQPADVSDGAQSTWLRLMQNLHTISDPERLSSWLAVTATRECLLVLRERAILGLGPMIDEAADPAVDLEASVTGWDTAHSHLEAVADLPFPQRPRHRNVSARTGPP